MKNITHDRTLRRKLRVSSNIIGSADRPRISVFRSNQHIYVQAIDDRLRKTICAVWSKKINREKKLSKKTETAKSVGQELARILIEKSIKSGIFDRGQYTYNGRVKAVAEGMREKGFII